MKKKIKHHDTLEIYELARKLGVQLDQAELQAAMGARAYDEAVSRCKCRGNVGECHLYLSGRVSAANNKWW